MRYSIIPEGRGASVPFEFEGKTFIRRVAVPNKNLINDRVLFAVPLEVHSSGP